MRGLDGGWVDVASVHELEDPAGNRLVVEALTGGTAVVTIIDDDREEDGGRQIAAVIVTPDEMQAVANAVKRACGGGEARLRP